MLFALASALRLARFNTLLEDDRPKWQSDFFMGVPTPAAAILVLLPIYLSHVGLDLRDSPILLNVVLVYVMLIGLMMVSILPTYSGKLLGERIEREWVLPLFIVSMLAVACLLTYPYPTLAIASIAYLAALPWTWKRYRELEQRHTGAPATASPAAVPPTAPVQSEPVRPTDDGSSDAAKRDAASGPSRVIEIRPGEKR
jgi:CDP-diacylglycerol--serine O-phosphatidyltransferase